MPFLHPHYHTGNACPKDPSTIELPALDGNRSSPKGLDSYRSNPVRKTRRNKLGSRGGSSSPRSLGDVDLREQGLEGVQEADMNVDVDDADVDIEACDTDIESAKATAEDAGIPPRFIL